MKVGSIVECVNDGVIDPTHPANFSLVLIQKGCYYTVEKILPYSMGIILVEVKAANNSGAFRVERFREIEFPPSLSKEISESLERELVSCK